MLVLALNAILVFYSFMHIDCRICNRLLLLFLYKIIALSVRIFFTSEDGS